MNIYDLGLGISDPGDVVVSGKPPVNVDLDLLWKVNKEQGNNRKMNRANMASIDRYFMEKGVPLPQRQALLYTILQESGADSLGAHGNGYYGLVGWSPERYNVIKDKSLMGQVEHLYNTLYNGTGKADWNYGGDGSGYNSWTDAQKAFLDAEDFDDAMHALTWGYVRPAPDVRDQRIADGGMHFGLPIKTRFANKLKAPVMPTPEGDYQTTPYILPDFKSPFSPTTGLFNPGEKSGFKRRAGAGKKFAYGGPKKRTVTNPEWSAFQERLRQENIAENIAASRGDYWDKNWFDPNYKNSAYSFDDNGVLTYNGQTYVPFGDTSKQGIVVPVRTPKGISYGSNVTYYPVEVPQQFIEEEYYEPDPVVNNELFIEPSVAELTEAPKPEVRKRNKGIGNSVVNNTKNKSLTVIHNPYSKRFVDGNLLDSMWNEYQRRYKNNTLTQDYKVKFGKNLQMLYDYEREKLKISPDSISPVKKTSYINNINEYRNLGFSAPNAPNKIRNGWLGRFNYIEKYQPTMSRIDKLTYNPETNEFFIQKGNLATTYGDKFKKEAVGAKYIITPKAVAKEIKDGVASIWDGAKDLFSGKGVSVKNPLKNIELWGNSKGLAYGGPLTKYNTKLPKGKEKEYSQWVESLPLNLRLDYDYDLRGAFLAGVKPDKYGHMTDKYKKPWHPTFSDESIYSTKDMQGGHWEGDEFVPSPWQERRQQLVESMGLMPNETFANGGTIHIKPENKGKFTAAAERAGKSVQGYASQILANPDNYSSTLVKRANFAHNAAKWHACGGKLYPDGGPIDPPWASFVPSQPREPQVIRPQQQVNPYLLGLSVGMGQNEAAKYSTAAQTPEFQQGYYDGRAQVVASEAAKAGRAPVVEPGIEVVSPGLDLSPVGDVRALVDAGEYYQVTGDLKTALGLAALGVIAVPGAGKAAERAGREFLDDVTSKEVQQFVKNREMLSGALESMKNYGKQNVPKPTGTLNYSIPSPEPMLSEVPYRLTITPPKPNPMRSLPEPRTFINPDGTVTTPGGAVFTPTVEHPINRLSAVEQQRLIKSIGDIDFNIKTEPKVNPTTTTTASNIKDYLNYRKARKNYLTETHIIPYNIAKWGIPAVGGAVAISAWPYITDRMIESDNIIPPNESIYTNEQSTPSTSVSDKLFDARNKQINAVDTVKHNNIQNNRNLLDSLISSGNYNIGDSIALDRYIRLLEEDSANYHNTYSR